MPKAGGDLFFLPFLYGSNAGLEMTSGFYGMQAIHTRAHLLQAIYEGVVFSHMTHLNRMRERFTVLLGSAVTYDIKAKASILHVDRTTGNQGRTEEWRRIRQVRFDSHLIRQLRCAEATWRTRSASSRTSTT